MPGRATHASLMGEALALHGPWLGLTVAFFWIAACTSESETRHGHETMRSDSAGVELVTTRAPTWTGDEGWWVSPEPNVSVGGMGSPEGHLIWEVRNAARLSDGRIAVLSGDHSAPRLLIFNRDGRLARQIGRSGRGPGEFVEPQFLQVLPGDTLVVWERHFGRVTSFDTTGAVVGLRHLDLERVGKPLRFGGPARIALPLGDGSFVAQASPPPLSPDDMPLGELYRPPIVYVRIRSDHSADTLGWYNALSLSYPAFPGPPVVPLFPFTSSIVASREPLRVLVSNGDGSGIHVFNAEGKLVRVIRRDLPPVAITRQDRERALGRLGGSDTEYARRVQAYAHQDFLPELPRLVVDGAGAIWAWEREHSDGWVDWAVFESKGTWLGRVRVPSMNVLGIGQDYILGLRTDSVGVESLHEYRLHRDGNAPHP